MVIADDDIKRQFQERACVADIFATADGGMRTLKMEGMEKIKMSLMEIKMASSVFIK